MDFKEKEIKEIVLFAYEEKATGKLGSMRVVDNTAKAIADIGQFMKRELEMMVYNAELAIINMELHGEHNEEKKNAIQEQIDYLKTISVVMCVLGNNKLTKETRFEPYHAPREQILDIEKARIKEEMEAESERKRMVELEKKVQEVSTENTKTKGKKGK